MQQQQLHRLQQQIKAEPADPVSQAQKEDSKKKDEVANCVIGGPPPPVESLLAHINSQLETGGGIKAEIDSEFLKLALMSWKCGALSSCNGGWSEPGG